MPFSAITKYVSGTGLGMLRMALRTSVRLKSTCVIITLVDPTDTAACVPAKAPAPIPPACVSLRPVTTWVLGERPSSSATSGRRVPTIASIGTRSGSFSRSISDEATRWGS